MRIASILIASVVILCASCAHPHLGGFHDGRAERLQSYAPSARTELDKAHCTRNFGFVGGEGDEEIYRATCDSGSSQKVRCDLASCRLINAGGKQALQQTAPEQSAVEESSGDGRAARLRSYASSAKSELGGAHCNRDFGFISSEGDVETYQATCESGSIQRVKCDLVACRLIK